MSPFERRPPLAPNHHSPSKSHVYLSSTSLALPPRALPLAQLKYSAQPAHLHPRNLTRISVSPSRATLLLLPSSLRFRSSPLQPFPSSYGPRYPPLHGTSVRYPTQSLRDQPSSAGTLSRGGRGNRCCCPTSRLRRPPSSLSPSSSSRSEVPAESTD